MDIQNLTLKIGNLYVDTDDEIFDKILKSFDVSNLKEFNYCELEMWLMNNDDKIIELIDFVMSEKIDDFDRIDKIPEVLLKAIIFGAKVELEFENFHTLQSKCQDFASILVWK